MDDRILGPEIKQDLPQGPSKWELVWHWLLTNKLVMIAAVAIIIAVGVVWLVFGRTIREFPPVSSNVLLLIKGPQQLSSGGEAEYRIVYRNGENADLVGVSLEVFYPPGFTFRTATPKVASGSTQRFDLPILAASETSEVTVRGKLVGATGEEKQLKASLHYRLSNFNSSFVVETSFATLILPPNLTLEITGPSEVTSGQDSTFSVSYSNVSSGEIDNLALVLTYPTGFNFTSSNPPPSKNNNSWNVAILPVSKSGKIEVTGRFSGDAYEEKLISANLGLVLQNNFIPQINTSAGFRIGRAALSLKQEASPSDFVNLGQTIQFSLNYTNQNTVGMTNVVIGSTLQGPSLDLTSLHANNAIITGNTLTWKSATLSNLSVVYPNQSGEINFTVPIKSNITTNLKNQTIKSKAWIASDQVTKPIMASDLEIKLATNLSLSVSGEYVSGSLPMQVGKPTVFSITWLVTNLSNDLANTEVIASMPLPASSWQNVILEESEKNRLTYDPNSGKIRWKIGDLLAFTGKFTPALRVTFRLQVVPTESDRNKTITLLKDVSAAGLDTFINKNIQSKMISEITPSSLGDEVINQRGSAVQ